MHYFHTLRNASANVVRQKLPDCVNCRRRWREREREEKKRKERDSRKRKKGNCEYMTAIGPGKFMLLVTCILCIWPIRI